MPINFNMPNLSTLNNLQGKQYGGTAERVESGEILNCGLERM